MSKNIGYINGEYLPLEEIRVSAMDRGFLFADSIYEVIPVYAGKLFRLIPHLERMQHSLSSIKLTIPYSFKDIQTILETLIAKNEKASEQMIYLQMTRGAAPIRDIIFPNNIKPTFFAYCNTIHTATMQSLQEGKRAITAEDIRWQHCEIKTTALLANVLMRERAQEAGADETILIHNDKATEATSSNLFIVKNNMIITPPLGLKILGGITRELILELADAEKISFTEKAISTNDLFAADEVWLTSSTKEIWPIVSIDGKTIGNGMPGNMWMKMYNAYQMYKKTLIGLT